MLLTMLRETLCGAPARAARRCPAGARRAWCRRCSASCHGDRGAVELAGRRAGRRPRRSTRSSRRPACAPARCARRATGAISGCAAGTAVLIVDAAPPPVARLVEGGCASTLAFELSDGAAPHRRQLRRRARGRRAAAARRSREGLRTTAAHSTLVARRQQFDRDPCRRHARPRRRRGRAERGRRATTASRIEASHDGYARRFGLLHRRQLIARPATAASCAARTCCCPRASAARRARPPFAIRFHLGAGRRGVADRRRAWRVAAPARRARCGSSAAAAARWRSRTACGSTATAARSPTQQLVVTGEAPPGGASVSWAFKRAS